MKERRKEGWKYGGKEEVRKEGGRREGWMDGVRKDGWMDGVRKKRGSEVRMDRGEIKKKEAEGWLIGG